MKSNKEWSFQQYFPWNIKVERSTTIKFHNVHTNAWKQYKKIMRRVLTVQAILDVLLNFTASSWICVANSLVGESTNTVGPILALLLVRLRWIKAGSKYPKVFPEPVLAMATISLLWSAMGHDCAWIGVGAENPAFCTYKRKIQEIGFIWDL